MSDAPADRLEELRKAKAQRADKEKEAEEARELEALELEEKLRGELGGERGVAFEIINNRFGVFGLKRPDTRAIRNWEQATEKQKVSVEWQVGLLRHYIVPQERGLVWAQTVGDNRPGLLWQTADAFVDLMGIDRAALEKKR